MQIATFELSDYLAANQGHDICGLNFLSTLMLQSGEILRAKIKEKVSEEELQKHNAYYQYKFAKYFVRGYGS